MKYNQLSWLLVASVALTPALSLTAYAEEDSLGAVVEGSEESSETVETITSGDYEYTLDGENATITHYGGSDADVVIPSDLDGHTVANLGGGAFAGSTGVVSITLPETVSFIDDSCFHGCTDLKTFTVEDGNESYAVTDGVLFSADGQDLICYPPATEGTSYTIPDGVVEVWSSAFAKSSLTSVTIPDSVLYLDDWSFAEVPLESLELPDSILEIGQYAFAYSPRLTEVVFPESLEIIDAAAFAGIENLTSVTFPDSLTTIQMAAFAGTGLTEVTIPATVTSIGFCAFGYDMDLTSAVENFVICGTVGSQAQIYCTEEDTENSYSNSFTFRSVMSEEVDEDETPVQTGTEEVSAFQKYIKWVLLGVGALILLVGGAVLLLGGKGKKKDKADAEAVAKKPETDDSASEKTEETSDEE